MLLLTAPGCHLCDFAKSVLGSIKNECPLVVTEQSFLSARGQELASRDGVLFPPGIYVDGKFFAYGRLSAAKLRKRLKEIRA